LPLEGHSIDHLADTRLSALVSTSLAMESNGSPISSILGQEAVELLGAPGPQSNVVTFASLAPVSVTTHDTTTGALLSSMYSIEGKVLWNGKPAAVIVPDQSLKIAYSDGTSDVGAGPGLLFLGTPPY
jgi:hypothetical protein